MSILLYLASIVATNVLFVQFGVVPVGFGLMAPAAVLTAGLVFLLRDAVHERYGPRLVIGLIILGTGICMLLSVQLALASGAAFLFSELADLAVYSRLRTAGRVRAVVASNIVGALIDSLIFLTIAFGSLAFLPGQLVGKMWATAGFLVGALLVRRFNRDSDREPATA